MREEDKGRIDQEGSSHKEAIQPSNNMPKDRPAIRPSVETF
jgi:hypothetical protein